MSKPSNRRSERYVEDIDKVAAKLESGGESCEQRKEKFKELIDRFEGNEDPIHHHMAKSCGANAADGGVRYTRPLLVAVRGPELRRRVVECAAPKDAVKFIGEFRLFSIQRWIVFFRAGLVAPHIGIEYPFPGITQDIEQPQVIGHLLAYRVHLSLCFLNTSRTPTATPPSHDDHMVSPSPSPHGTRIPTPPPSAGDSPPFQVRRRQWRHPRLNLLGVAPLFLGDLLLPAQPIAIAGRIVPVDHHGHCAVGGQLVRILTPEMVQAIGALGSPSGTLVRGTSDYPPGTSSIARLSPLWWR